MEKQFNLNEKRVETNVLLTSMPPQRTYCYHEVDVKEFIKRLKEDLILSRNKYGLDWCDSLYLKHIDKLAGDKLK